jgi:DNA-directed RNA polymerase subunit K/omega
MQHKHTRDEISLSSQDTAAKIGNLFDTVLVLSQRIREIKCGHAAMVNQGTSPLSTAMHEIAAGKVTRSWLNREPPENNSRRKYHK